MTILEAEHFCNVKISSESPLCAVGSCLQLSNWHCVLLPVITESQHVTTSVYCCKVEALSVDNCSHLALDPSVHCFSFICSAAEQQLVKSFFFPFMFLLCYLLQIVFIFVFFSQPLLQLPPNLHSCCLYVTWCLFLCIICILSPFIVLLIYYSHFLLMPASCILFSSVAEIPLYLLVFTCGFQEAGEADTGCCKKVSDLFFVGGD